MPRPLEDQAAAAASADAEVAGHRDALLTKPPRRTPAMSFEASSRLMRFCASSSRLVPPTAVAHGELAGNSAIGTAVEASARAAPGGAVVAGGGEHLLMPEAPASAKRSLTACSAVSVPVPRNSPAARLADAERERHRVRPLAPTPAGQRRACTRLLVKSIAVSSVAAVKRLIRSNRGAARRRSPRGRERRLDAVVAVSARPDGRARDPRHRRPEADRRRCGCRSGGRRRPRSARCDRPRRAGRLCAACRCRRRCGSDSAREARSRAGRAAARRAAILSAEPSLGERPCRDRSG